MKKVFIIETTYAVCFKKSNENVNSFYFDDVVAVEYSEKCTDKMVRNYQEHRIVKSCKGTMYNPFRSVVVNQIRKRYPNMVNEDISEYTIDWCFTHVEVVPHDRCLPTEAVKSAVAKLK